MDIINYKSNYKQSIVSILQDMWQGLDESEIRQRFEWRYEQNPHQKTPCIYLAVDGERLAGFRAFVQQIFQFRNNKYYVLSPADVIVHPDYRRQGIFSKLNNAAIQDIHNTFGSEGIILNLSSNKLSTPGYLKKSWQKVNCLKRYCYKASWINCIKNKITSRKPNKGHFPNKRKSNGYELKITPELKAKEMAEFAQKQRNPDQLANIRDEAFFVWRYAYQAEQYIYVYCYKDSTMQGYLVIKKMSDIQCTLEEYSAVDPDIMKLMVSTAMKELSTGVMRAWDLSMDDRAWLGKSGFIPEPVKLLKRLGKERLSVLVRPTAPELSEDDFFVEGLDIRDIQNWRIHLSDKH